MLLQKLAFLHLQPLINCPGTTCLFYIVFSWDKQGDKKFFGCLCKRWPLSWESQLLTDFWLKQGNICPCPVCYIKLTSFFCGLSLPPQSGSSWSLSYNSLFPVNTMFWFWEGYCRARVSSAVVIISCWASSQGPTSQCINTNTNKHPTKHNKKPLVPKS